MLDPRLLPDVVDRKLDVVCEPVRLDDGLAAGVLAAAIVEHVTHRQDSFERVTLRTARR
jgi:hypothetical protein